MQATIIGAGIAGLALAKGLRCAGFDVQVFEQAPELKPVGAGLALTTNGLRALQSRACIYVSAGWTGSGGDGAICESATGRTPSSG